MEWYNNTLNQPKVTPPNWVFPIAWNIIFILATASALIVWNKFKHGFFQKLFHKDAIEKFWWIIGLFIANAVLNVIWTLLFFQLTAISAALIEMTALLGTTIALIILIWKNSKWAALMLLPYALWISFATYLTYQIWILNI